MKVFLYLLVTICYVECGKRRLSDPQGLSDEAPFQYGSRGLDYVSGTVWPKPQEEKRENVLFSVDPAKFKFTSTGLESDVVDEALVRYVKLTFPDGKTGKTVVDLDNDFISGLEVNVVYPYEPLDLSSDESYILTINAPTSTLKANTPWGALKGLETFSQVVYQNETGFYFAQKNAIVDYPRFHHRGFLIDTSRHYVSLNVIMQFLDAMAYSKFNVFHWHIVDDQSFPFVSITYPSLHSTGAYNNKSHIYTPEDIAKVIDYARFRGIRVLPEFDTPGHTQSWYSIPHLLTTCYSGDKPNGNFGPIDPTVESNYEFLESFFREVSMVFPDQYLHMGGDEVDFSCWKSNPNITAWMATHGMAGNYSLLEQYYEQRLLDIIGKLGKGYVIWQEVIDNQVKVQADTVVNVWKGGWQKEMLKVTQQGYRAIISSPWYLNYISYGPDWPSYYTVDPQVFNGTAEQIELVIGGTACMWGEWVDGTNLIARTWGRGMSVGERLWSSKDTRDLTDATKRIWEQRCRYLRRGIQAENVVQSQYCRHEWMNTH